MAEPGLVQLGDARLLQQVRRQGGGVHHRGHADGEDRHAQSLFVQRRPVVPHAGAGDDARVRELHRGAHPAHPPGGQSVDGDDQGRLHLCHQAPDGLGGLYAGGAQHPGPEHRHGPEPGEVLGAGGDEVPGDQHAVCRQGAHGVRGHGGVPQTHDEGGALFGEHGLQLGPHGPDGPLKKVRLPLPEAGQVDGEIGPLGLSQGLLPPPVQDIHPGDGVALLLGLRGLYAGEPGGLLRGLLPELPGLQGQIGALCKHRTASQTENDRP